MMILIEKRLKGETFRSMAKTNKGGKGELLMEGARFTIVTSKKKKGKSRSKTPTNFNTKIVGLLEKSTSPHNRGSWSHIKIIVDKPN